MSVLGAAMALGLALWSPAEDGPVGASCQLADSVSAATLALQSGAAGGAADHGPAEHDSPCVSDVDALPPEVLLVDMRSRPEREAIWLDMALQEVSVDVIATRPVFQQGPLALFGNGLDDARLVDVCERLRAGSSQSIHVVGGGLRALAWAGHTPSGDPRALAALNELSPLELHQLLSWSRVQAVAVGEWSLADRAAFGPHVEWRETLDALTAEGREPGLLVLPVGTDAQQWVATHVAPGRPPPLVYTEGPEAYTAFVSESTFKAAERVRTAPLRCAG